MRVINAGRDFVWKQGAVYQKMIRGQDLLAGKLIEGREKTMIR